MTAIRVLIVDDQPTFRQAVRKDLEDYPNDVVVVGEASGGEQAIELAGEADVVLMDIQMRGMNGITAMKLLAELHPHCRVVLFTIARDRQYILEGLHAGAAGYLLKDCSSNELISAITSAYHHEAVLSPPVATTVIHEVRAIRPRIHTPVSLTVQEVEIVRGIAAGSSNKQIAAYLNLSEGTINQYIKRINDKLGANHRAHMIAIAKDYGIV